jgi:hypothetical protein
MKNRTIARSSAQRDPDADLSSAPSDHGNDAQEDADVQCVRFGGLIGRHHLRES